MWLKVISFEQNDRDTSAQQWVDLIVEFKKLMGRFPREREEYKGKQIGTACSHLRQAYKHGRLSRNIIDQLNAIGFPWQIKSSPRTNKQWADLIVEFRREKSRSPKQGEIYKGEKIGMACNNIRQSYKNDQLEQDIIDQLNAVNFDWQRRTSPKTIREWTDLIIAFHKETDRFPHRREVYKGEKIGAACSRIRLKYKNNTLEKNIIDQLNAVGFPWEVTEEKGRHRHLAPARSTGRKAPVVPRAPSRYTRRESRLERFNVLLDGDNVFEKDATDISDPRGYEGGRAKHDVSVLKNEDPPGQVILYGLHANIRDLGKCVTGVTNYDRKPGGRTVRPAKVEGSRDRRTLTFRDLLDSAEKIFVLLIEEDRTLLREKLVNIEKNITDLDKVKELVSLLQQLQKEYNNDRVNAYKEVIKRNYKDRIVALVEEHKDDPSKRGAGLQVLSSWDIVVNDLTEEGFRNMIDDLVKGQPQVIPNRRLKGRFVKVIRQLRLGLQEHSAEGKALEMTITKEAEEILARRFLK
jgi:hypothetical protein